MRKVSKIIAYLLITITLSTIIFLNKKEVKSNGMFAIMLETSKGTGKYDYAKDNKWPQSDEYVINMYKTYCEKGSVLRWNNETKKINATVKGTDKCYVYFDLSEYGDEEHTYLIQTIEDLVRLSNDVNGGTTYAGKYFLLTNDLDFQDEADYEDANRTDFKDINGINGDEALIKELTTGSGFIPIGNSSTNSFQGIFEGNNKTLSNLYINNNIDGARLGLFGITKGANISNLTITGNLKSNIKASIGGFVGDAYNTTLVNVHNEAKITSTSKDWHAAGLMGAVMEETKIINSTNKGAIEGGANSAGFIGYINSGAIVSIKNSNNEGNISNGNTTTGGLVGYTYGILTIDRSNNYGNITNNVGIYIGGIMGRDNSVANSTIINNSHNEGDIISNIISNSKYIGGLLGSMYGDIEINNSYNIGNITSSGEMGVTMGGLVGIINKKITIANSYNSNNTIKISPNGFENSEIIGGIIGRVTNENEISIIKNSYNTGEIINGVRVGGLIGEIDSGMLMDKCYNTGNIYNEGEVYIYQSQIGGLIGATSSYSFFHPKDIILNCYNVGNITANNKTTTRIAGLIQNIHSNNVIILNSFNVGNLDLQSDVGSVIGLVYSAYVLQNQSTENNTNTLNNLYNLGTVSGTVTDKYSLGYFATNVTINDIKNTYYVNNFNGSNLVNLGTGMTLEQMKQQTFVNELNQNVENINIEEIDSSLKGYTLSKWTLGKDGYPTLVNY